MITAISGDPTKIMQMTEIKEDNALVKDQFAADHISCRGCIIKKRADSYSCKSERKYYQDHVVSYVG